MLTAGCDPDRRGALVLGEALDGGRLRIAAVVDLALPAAGPARATRLASIADVVRGLGMTECGQWVAVEAALRGGPAGNVRGLVAGMLSAIGLRVVDAPVRRPRAWWAQPVEKGGRVSLPGVPAKQRGIAEGVETCRRYVVDAEGGVWRPVSSGQAQAACLARWLALQPRGRR